MEINVTQMHINKGTTEKSWSKKVEQHEETPCPILMALRGTFDNVYQVGHVRKDFLPGKGGRSRSQGPDSRLVAVFRRGLERSVRFIHGASDWVRYFDAGQNVDPITIRLGREYKAGRIRSPIPI